MPFFPTSAGRLAAAAAVAALLAAPGAHARDPSAEAAALRDKLDEVRPRLERNGFGRPLHLDSRESSGELAGEVFALLEHPFSRVGGALAEARQWCDVLTLPFNVQRCEARDGVVTVSIGRKPDSPIEEATRLELRFALSAKSDELLKVRLSAPQGPAGTSDYRIAFEAIPAGERRTFVHLGYGYAHGVMSRMAMQAYLSTAGAGKVGFTAEGTDAQGRPRLVGGMRGVLERNTMRYFLAIDAYLDAMSAPPERRRLERLERWFRAVERYPRQLREMSREEYLALKQK